MQTSLNKTLAYLFTSAVIAAVRNRLQSKKAQRTGKPILACLLSALESSESAHARRFKMYLRGKSGDGKEFLRAYRQSKANEIAPLYAEMASHYAARGEAGKAENLRQFAGVLAAQDAMLARYESEAEKMPAEIQVCQICGFVTTDRPPDKCPVCNAVRKKFVRFAI